jgi:hypothetical protein
MKLFTKNIVSIGRVVAFLFFVASSGFTTILHICTMEAMECCDTSGASDHDACANAESPSPVAGASIQNVDDCHMNVVVGGLAANQAMLEKESKVQNVSVLDLFVSTFVSLALNTNTSSFNYSYSESVSPPSVEKCVLNETFLI